jgi:hypothetical protein
LRFQWIVVWIVAAGVLAACSRQESSWQDAAAENSIAAYERYLADFPAGPHAGIASARVAELMEQEAWSRANRLQTPEAWQRYLGEWPNGRHAPAARRQLTRFMPDDVPAAGAAWSVQLGAYSSEAAARKDLARHARERAGELSGVRLVIRAPSGIATDVWRLRTTPLDEATARELCGKLREHGVDCVPVVDESAGHAPP